MKEQLQEADPEHIRETVRNDQKNIDKNIKHPKYQSMEARIASYLKWPSNRTQTPQQLADAGLFFSGSEDCVTCYYCGGGLRGWDPGDDPWHEHCRWFPSCHFALQRKGKEFIARVQASSNENSENASEREMTSSMQQMSFVESANQKEHEKLKNTCLEMGYSLADYAEAVKDLRNRGVRKPDMSAIIDAIEILKAREKQAEGIVGAGVGGTSAAYFLRELFGDNVEIDIFEKQSVGGRLAPILIGGQKYNAGGTIIHPANIYMVNFTHLLELERDTRPEPGRLGLYDGEDLLFTTSEYSAVTIAKLFWRYGMDVYNIKNWIKEKILKPLSRLYDFQNEGHAFSTVEDLMNAMDPTLVEYSRKSIKTLLKEDGFSDPFIDEFVMGAMRVNYGQTNDIQGLVGAISMAGVEPGLWNVVGGNHLVPQGLLKKAEANLIKGKVTMVSLSSDGSPPVYQLDYLPGTSTDIESTKSKEYDIVILATPFYKGLSDIEFEDFQNTITPVDNDFHLTVATFIEGSPNSSYFKIDSADDLPSTILTTSEKVFFNSFTKQKSVTGETTDTPVYRMFSNKVPSVDELKELVPEWKDLRVVNWMAYPEYTSSVNLPSFTLHEQMYHINAIEMAGSAMEMSAISAKNIALLAYYRYTGQYDKIDEIISSDTTDDQKSEL